MNFRIQTKNKLFSRLADSTSNSPVTIHPPCELPTVQSLPQNLLPLNGFPTKNRRTANDQKIVLYILAADNGHKTEKSVLHSLFNDLKTNCAARGFEIYLSDVHQRKDENFLDAACWIDGPLEAKGGHHLAANCLAEITRKCFVKFSVSSMKKEKNNFYRTRKSFVHNSDHISGHIIGKSTVAAYY